MIICILMFHKHRNYFLRGIKGFNRKRIKGFIFLNWGTKWMRFFKLTFLPSGSGVRDLYLSRVRHAPQVLEGSGCQWLSDVRKTLKTDEWSRPCASFLSSQLLCCGNHVLIFCVSSYNSVPEVRLQILHLGKQATPEVGEQNCFYLGVWL